MDEILHTGQGERDPATTCHENCGRVAREHRMARSALTKCSFSGLTFWARKVTLTVRPFDHDMHIPPNSRLVVSAALGELKQLSRPVASLLTHQDHAFRTPADAGNGERVGFSPSPPPQGRREGANTNMLACTPPGIDLWDFDTGDALFRKRTDDGVVESSFQDT